MQHPRLCLLGTRQPLFAGLRGVAMGHSFPIGDAAKWDTLMWRYVSTADGRKAREGCLRWKRTLLGCVPILRQPADVLKGVPCVRPPDYASSWWPIQQRTPHLARPTA